MVKRIGLLIFLLLQCASLFALQTKEIKDNQTVFFKISAKELTRIFVENDRIQSTRGLEGNYQLTKDEVNGAIFIKPLQQRAFNLFISTVAGRNYTLFLSPIGIPAEVIQLKPISPIKKKAELWEKNTPYLDAIAQLMKTMINDTPFSEGYSMVDIETKEIKKLPSGINMQLKKIYQGSLLQGEVWLLKNRYCKSMQIQYREFYQDNVRAIALKDNRITNCGSTYLYRVVSL